MSFPILTDNRESPGVTFADPGSTRSVGQVAVDALASVGRTVSDPYVNPQPYADIFHAAERSMRLTGNIVSEGQARAEAYDQRIKAAKAATGIDLENPERGGYAIDARKAIAQEVRAGGIASIDAKGGIPEYQRRIFDRKLAELQKGHPELQFGDADAQARALARGATEDAAKATSADVNPVASVVAQFAGGLVGSRRDPLFVGSLFAGPTTAVGRTALARVASSSLFSGLYNAGVSAAEQPTVQEWRARIGVEHGVLPAMQDVGLAFLTGAIPGAGIQAIKESVRAPLQRVLAGHPEPGDIAAIHDVIPLAERDHAALQAGEESVAADKATLTIPAPKDIPEPLHNDMLAAALKRADDPAEPSPAAVEAVKQVEAALAPQERIASSAIRYKGKTYTGIIHSDAYEAAAVDAGVRTNDIFNAVKNGDDTGFITSTGRYVDREEAKSIAAEADQLNLRGRQGPERLSAEDLKDQERLGLPPFREELIAQDLKEGYAEPPKPTPPPIPEVQQRIAEAAPKSEAEAHVVADEALDDVGRNAGMAALRDRMATADAERAPPAIPPEEPAAAPRARGDVIDKVPWVDGEGRPKLIGAKGAAAVGERETTLSMLVRSCK